MTICSIAILFYIISSRYTIASIVIYKLRFHDKVLTLFLNNIMAEQFYFYITLVGSFGLPVGGLLDIMDATCDTTTIVCICGLHISLNTKNTCLLTFCMTCFLKNSLVAAEIFFSFPILHFTYPYKFAPFKTIAIHTSSSHLNFKLNNAATKNTDHKSGQRIKANQKIRASVVLIRFCWTPWNTGYTWWTLYFVVDNYTSFYYFFPSVIYQEW